MKTDHPIHTRPAERGDLPRLTEIYDRFVLNTPVTFDIEPYTVERRTLWFEQFAAAGRRSASLTCEPSQRPVRLCPTSTGERNAADRS